MTTLQDLLDEAMGRPAYTAFTDRRPVPYRNDRAPRPLPRTMRPPEAAYLASPPPAEPQGLIAGQVAPGNIDLAHRPVVRNPDGSISTVRSISVEMGGRHFLLPTVSPDGRILPDDQAVDLFRQTGQNLGEFRSDDNADAYAQRLHSQQEQFYMPAPRYEDLQGLQDQFFQRRSQRRMEGNVNEVMGRTALPAQGTPDPEHTPLENGVLGVARAYGPGAAYDAVRAGARVANGDRGALGDLALNTGIAALPFLGVRGLRGEPAPVPMREALPAEAPRPVAPDAGSAGPARVVRRTIDAPHAPGYGTGTFEILQNPTVAQIERFVSREMRDPGNSWVREARRTGTNPKEYYPLRYLQDARGNIYISSGLDVEHGHMAQGLRAQGVDLGNDLNRSEFGVGQLQYRNGQWQFERGFESSGGDFATSNQVFEPLDPSYPNVRPESPVAPDGGGAGAPTATERYPFGFRPVSDEPWAQSRLRTDQFYPVDTARDYGDAVHAPEIAPTDVPVDSLVGTQESIGSRFLNRPSTGNEPVSVYRAEDGQMYIIDGHHRVAGAVARGEPTVSARVYSPENPPINTREPEIQAAIDARLRPEFDGGQWHIVENGQRLRTLPQGTSARDAMRAADEMRRTRPPPTDPKSLPRRPTPKTLQRYQPPTGGFFTPEGNP